MNWPYKNIKPDELDSVIKICEQITVSLGATPVTKRTEKETWFLSEEDCITEMLSKQVYRFRDSYVCIDKMYFPEKPFVVLEIADEIDGPYEDADPFPYDLPMDELKLEIQYALGILPYPTMQEKMISENSIPEYSKLMAWNGRYAIYNVYEDAFLLDTQDNQIYEVGDYYGDPELAMIDKQETFAVVVGSDHLGVFDLVNKELNIIDVDIQDWIISINQEGRKIEVICEQENRYIFEI